ncbi:hypothetical protein FKM82_024185 [Ascaphus truei]
MGHWEFNHIFSHTNPCRKNIIFYRRFIDDLFMIWEGDAELLREFVDHLNTNQLHLQFTFSFNPDTIEYLDLKLYIDSDLHIQSDLFRKPNSRNAFLRANSGHPKSLLKGIPKAQFLRVKQICSNMDSFLIQSKELASRFTERGYQEADIQSAFELALHTPRNSLLNIQGSTKKKKKTTT